MMTGHRSERRGSGAIRALAVISILCIGGSAAAQLPDLHPQPLDDYATRTNALDVGVIVDARNQPAAVPTDPRDLDGDGRITMLDARIYAEGCSLVRADDPVDEIAIYHVGTRRYCGVSLADRVRCGNTEFGSECGVVFDYRYPLVADSPYQPPGNPYILCNTNQTCPLLFLDNIVQQETHEDSIVTGDKCTSSLGGAADACALQPVDPSIPGCQDKGTNQAEHDAYCQSLIDEWRSTTGADTVRHPDYSCAPKFKCYPDDRCEWDENQYPDEACCNAATNCVQCADLAGCFPTETMAGDFLCSSNIDFGVTCASIGETSYPPLPLLDDDGDGVSNNDDQCPGTPAGTPVDVTGCPTMASQVATPAPVASGRGLLLGVILLLGVGIWGLARREKLEHNS